MEMSRFLVVACVMTPLCLATGCKSLAPVYKLTDESLEDESKHMKVHYVLPRSVVDVRATLTVSTRREGRCLNYKGIDAAAQANTQAFRDRYGLIDAGEGDVPRTPEASKKLPRRYALDGWTVTTRAEPDPDAIYVVVVSGNSDQEVALTLDGAGALTSGNQTVTNRTVEYAVTGAKVVAGVAGAFVSPTTALATMGFKSANATVLTAGDNLKEAIEEQKKKPFCQAAQEAVERLTEAEEELLGRPHAQSDGALEKQLATLREYRSALLTEFGEAVVTKKQVETLTCLIRVTSEDVKSAKSKEKNKSKQSTMLRYELVEVVGKEALVTGSPSPRVSCHAPSLGAGKDLGVKNGELIALEYDVSALEDGVAARLNEKLGDEVVTTDNPGKAALFYRAPARVPFRLIKETRDGADKSTPSTLQVGRHVVPQLGHVRKMKLPSTDWSPFQRTFKFSLDPETGALVEVGSTTKSYTGEQVESLREAVSSGAAKVKGKLEEDAELEALKDEAERLELKAKIKAAQDTLDGVADSE